MSTIYLAVAKNQWQRPMIYTINLHIRLRFEEDERSKSDKLPHYQDMTYNKDIT